MERAGTSYFAAKEPGLKLVVDAGFSCPHGRCTFCDNAAFHPSYSTPSKSITQQLDEGIAFHAARGRAHGPYLAYFQSFSNTFAPLARLQEAYGEALAHPAVSGLVIGTRPDCVDAEKLDYIASLGCARIEYGIESCRDKTLLRVHRGHDFACAERAVRETAARGIPVCGHFILGLPGETRETLLEDVPRINALPLDGIKFHQLQLLKGTPMAEEFAARPEDPMDAGRVHRPAGRHPGAPAAGPRRRPARRERSATFPRHPRLGRARIGPAPAPGAALIRERYLAGKAP